MVLVEWKGDDEHPFRLVFHPHITVVFGLPEALRDHMIRDLSKACLVPDAEAVTDTPSPSESDLTVGESSDDFETNGENERAPGNVLEPSDLGWRTDRISPAELETADVLWLRLVEEAQAEVRAIDDRLSLVHEERRELEAQIDDAQGECQRARDYRVELLSKLEHLRSGTPEPDEFAAVATESEDELFRLADVLDWRIEGLRKSLNGPARNYAPVEQALAFIEDDGAQDYPSAYGTEGPDRRALRDALAAFGVRVAADEDVVRVGQSWLAERTTGSASFAAKRHQLIELEIDLEWVQQALEVIGRRKAFIDDELRNVRVTETERALVVAEEAIQEARQALAAVADLNALALENLTEREQRLSAEADGIRARAQYFTGQEQDDQSEVSAGTVAGPLSWGSTQTFTERAAARTTREVREALERRLAVLQGNAHGELVPLVISPAFDKVTPEQREHLLEALGALESESQVIVPTGSRDVLAWAEVLGAENVGITSFSD